MKFTPENMLKKITFEEINGGIKIVYPHFIASKYDLEISILKIKDRYYMHENGCVVHYLKENGSYSLFIKNRKKLEKVFGCVFANDKLQKGCERGERGYFDFLKNIIFIMNLELVLPFLDLKERYRVEECYISNFIGEKEDISGLKELIRFKFFEKDDGYFVSSGIWYSNSDVAGSTVFMRELEDGMVYIDDGETHFKYHREVLELLMQQEGNNIDYTDLIDTICEKYGIQMFNNRISMKSKPNTEILLNNYFRFMQASVLLSECGKSGVLCLH